mmetsp:Transcript_4039/g.11409  ORF Transcript_4039/g.11409 Transcript_4039/m.11409 type:complete len:86 (+) Transcript_4039:486-743(+)
MQSASTGWGLIDASTQRTEQMEWHTIHHLSLPQLPDPHRFSCILLTLAAITRHHWSPAYELSASVAEEARAPPVSLAFHRLRFTL